jgi:iron complex transport system ATP-binding protein
VIDVEGVRLEVGDTRVLEGIDLAVESGEFLGLVGPNGAGKTSLLRTVNGVLAPDAGTVRIDGDAVGNLGAKAVGRRVATVPQDTHLDFAFTVEQLVEMGRTPHRSRLDWSAASDAVDRALARTETAHLRDRTADEISGGERQRVLLARALAQETPVLVLDEPTASLDVNHQIQVLEMVRDLVDDGRTAVAAIHDLDLAARYCDRLALLHDGTLERVGPPAAVLQSATLEAAFDTAAAITEDPVTATPRVTAVGDRPDRDTHVHVVGGGRPAARALGDCWAAGFEVSAGIVPEGDAVATLADDLQISVVTAQPFAAVDASAREAVQNAMERADVVVRATDDPPAEMADLLADVEPVVAWPGSAADLDGSDRDASTATEPEQAPPPAAARPVVRAVLEATSGGAPSDD